MIESQHFPKSRVKAEFHSSSMTVEFVTLEQDGVRMTLTPEDCLSITMRVLEKRRTKGPLPPPLPGFDAQKGCQG